LKKSRIIEGRSFFVATKLGGYGNPITGRPALEVFGVLASEEEIETGADLRGRPAVRVAEAKAEDVCEDPDGNSWLVTEDESVLITRNMAERVRAFAKEGTDE
jgi:hypothetical protein